MIQSILLFALGFLCAGLLALMIAPRIWRRAVRLTRKRVEAAVPLSMAEIQADKDRIRAEFAMSARRLEIAAKRSREKATAQIIEINRNQEELKSLALQRAEETRIVAELNRKAGDLDGELRRKEDQLRRLAEKLAAAEIAEQERAREIEKLGGLYDEASFSSSARQIELVARESEIDRLRGDLSTFRDRCEEAEAELKAARQEAAATAGALDAEKARAAALEAKINGMAAALADTEDRLERRDRELALLNERLESPTGAGGEPPAGAASDRELFEKRLTILTRENRKLKEELAAVQGNAAGGGSSEEGAMLREQMSDLAALVVALTALEEGPDSPVVKALGGLQPKPVGDEGEKGVSLADRIRAKTAALAG